MKNVFVSVLTAAIVAMAGCSTVDKPAVGDEGIVYKDAARGIKVWKAKEVDLSKYKTLVVPRPLNKAPVPKKRRSVSSLSAS